MRNPFSLSTRILSWLMALSFMVACWGDEPEPPTPPAPVTPVDPNPPTPEKDTTAPTITVSKSTINIISGPSLTVSGNEMKIGSDLVASWKDDKSTTFTVSITLTPTGGTAKTINSGDKLSEEGKLQVKVSDEAGISSEAEITLTKTDSQAPEISIKIQEKNVIAGVKVVVDGSQLYFDDQVAATWKDDFSETCKVEISLVPDEGESRAINSGDTIKDSGKLMIQVQDEYDNKATAEITLTKNDSQAPTITLLIQEKNVIAGVKVAVEGNQLFFDEQVAAKWADDFTETFTVRLSKDGQPINSGDIILDAGKLVLSVADDFQNEATAEIILIAEAIYGLEWLKNLSLQVDQEVNLLQGITYADGVSLDKVEIEAQGNRIVVSDPAHYVPQTPGTISIIITVKAGSRLLEFREDNLMVKGLDYTAPKMKTADVIGEKYSWYNNLRPKKQEFIYDHILISYVAMEWCKVDSMEFIIFGEATQDIECENVGFEDINEHTTHADFGFRGIQSISPSSTIKTCGGTWDYLESYVSQHPEKLLIVSCASGGSLGTNTREKLFNNPSYSSLKSILGKENIVVLNANWNLLNAYNIILNETEIECEKWRYSSTSVNSGKNNKYCVLGYDPYQNNILLNDSACLLPVGNFWKWNMIVDFISILNDGSTCSYPTSQFSSTLGNHLSILMHNNPGTTLEGANSILLDTYLYGEPLKYKDETDGTIKEGNLKYRIDTQKFIHNEILHETAVKSALQGNPQSLPSQGGLYYEGMGIQFSIDGNNYDMTEENRATLEDAVKSWKEITWTYNRDKAKKYGVSGANTIKVGVMDKSARLIPDLSLTIQVI